jgi:hypothetical protein
LGEPYVRQSEPRVCEQRGQWCEQTPTEVRQTSGTARWGSLLLLLQRLLLVGAFSRPLFSPAWARGPAGQRLWQPAWHRHRRDRAQWRSWCGTAR